MGRAPSHWPDVAGAGKRGRLGRTGRQAVHSDLQRYGLAKRALATDQASLQLIAARAATSVRDWRYGSERNQGNDRRSPAYGLERVCVLVDSTAARARHEPLARPYRLGRRLSVRICQTRRGFRLLQRSRFRYLANAMRWRRTRMQSIRLHQKRQRFKASFAERHLLETGF